MKQNGARKSVWQRILVYFLATMLFLTLVSRAADTIMLPVVKCARPLPGALSHTVMLSGVVEAGEQWPVMAFTGLVIARVHVRSGQSVHAGDMLLSYDAETLKQKLDEQQEQLKRLALQARLDTLEQPAGELSDDAGNEKRDLRRQLSGLEIGRVQREVDRLAQILYGGAMLAAPADGVISDVLVAPGDISSGAAFRLAPASSGLIMRCAVTEDQMERLRLGMEARFKRLGDTRADNGVAILRGLSTAQTGHEAIFELKDGGGAIGQTITITAKQATETYDMRVPLGAIAYQSGITGVYLVRTRQSVLGDAEYAEFVTVTVVDADSQYAAISGTLFDKDLVIVSSNKPFSSGDRVRSVP